MREVCLPQKLKMDKWTQRGLRKAFRIYSNNYIARMPIAVWKAKSSHRNFLYLTKCEGIGNSVRELKLIPDSMLLILNVDNNDKLITKNCMILADYPHQQRKREKEKGRDEYR